MKMNLLMENWRKYLNEVMVPEEVPEVAPGGEEERQYGSNDFCAEFPNACREAYGTQRKDMPQIASADAFEAAIEAPAHQGLETNEPEKIPELGQATRDYLKSSNQQAPYPAGDQVPVKEFPNVDPSSLKPTQKDIYIDNALKKVASGEKAEAAGGGWTPWDGAVLVSKDDYLLDGHHRWAATIIYNDKHPDNVKKMTIEKVGMGIEPLLKVANAYTDATGGARAAGGETTT
jgi:hypothetical protein